MSTGRWSIRVGSKKNNTTGCVILDRNNICTTAPQQGIEICLGCQLPKCILDMNKNTLESRKEAIKLRDLYYTNLQKN